MGRPPNIVRQFHLPDGSRFVGRKIDELAKEYEVRIDSLSPDRSSFDQRSAQMPLREREGISAMGPADKVLAFMDAVLTS